MQINDERELVFDDFAWKLAEHLLEDFKPFVSPSFHDAAKEASASRNVDAWRALTCGEIESLQPYQLKTTMQLCELFKKFSFSQDLRTPAQLREDSIKKFMDNQERLQVFALGESHLTRDILFRARGHADQILGDFEPLEICERATFGRKSSVGIPMRQACEGSRYEAPMTGSREHIAWFDKYYGIWNRPAHDYVQARAVLLKEPPYRVIDTLEAVLVDKTWKSLRMIMPNTTLGTLYSSGLGRVIEDRLRSFNYDIRHLQKVHGELARFGSLTGSLVTADQSMASDNITTALVERVFPRFWASALNFGRISEMRLYGKSVSSPTFATMGIGFTFPLQTLVFLVLLLAIRDHLELDEQTVISVFGDDLIYDSRMHSTVVEVFPSLGLVLNADKTFATGSFRESCGYDYFRGVDVRPFHLGRATGTRVGRRRAEAYLYTTINNALRRWEPYELPSTLDYLLGLVRKVRKDEVLLVPTDYPDTSGVKATPETAYLLGIERKIKKNRNGLFQFRCLAFEPELRSEDRHVPYYFLSLRRTREVVSLPFPKKFGKTHGAVIGESINILRDVEDPSGGTTRSKLSGVRHRRKLTVIPQQDNGRYRERPGSSVSWGPGNDG